MQAFKTILPVKNRRYAAAFALLLLALPQHGRTAGSSLDEAAWLRKFVDLSSSPAFFSAKGASVPAALASLVTLEHGAWACPVSWSLATGGAPPFVDSLSLDLLRPESMPCDEAHAGVLMMVVKTARRDGDAAAMAETLSARFGTPRLIVIGPDTNRHWQIAPGTAIEVDTSSAAEEAGQIMVRVAQVP